MENIDLNIPDNQKIITLIGSSKHKRVFDHIKAILTYNNKIVLDHGVYIHADKLELSNQKLFELDKLHKEKIASSHAVFLINYDNTWGDATASQFCYSRYVDIPIYHCFEKKGIN